MFTVRPIRESDLPDLVFLANATGGLTTLPPDEDFLGGRIADSLRAFNPRVKRPGGEYYLFVLEDSATGEIIGTSGIASRVGGFDPCYSYEIRAEKFTHLPLKIEKEIATLHLKREHRGPSEVCSLFLRPDRRQGRNGRLLSLARFLFVAAYRQRFTATIIAELRGYVDEAGRSPFWDAVGRIFFEFEFYRADMLSGLGDKEFIADLMPKHPIFVPLLPPEVRAVIGRVHPQTEPALALLRAEGFAMTNEVDIFDAGPLVRAETDQIRTIRECRTAVVKALVKEAPANPTHLISNASLDFRACLDEIKPHADGITISETGAKALGVGLGDRISFSPVK
ncbi:MAG: arginine N-succinyltransferase [Cephaloticoccus sp.]|nr:arginine N-succinyltransferase [Cephaloticoccus sp.]MCF7760643.1 arginine N-succinyltransferase [Cephaloticoccus sp.]